MPSAAVLEMAQRLSAEEQMFLVRRLEDRLQDLCLDGLAGDLHFSKGQEAVSVGVCAALRPFDYVVTHHRTIAHAVAKGVPLVPMLAEILGKEGGLNGGMAGEMHMSHPLTRFMFSFQLVGTCLPVAAGLAWAVKNVHKTDDVVAVFHGDAATANGQWHEGMNLAAVHQVPLLVVCENNELAGNVRPVDYMPVKRVTERAHGYHIPVMDADGNDLEAVMQAARFAVKCIRENRGPVFLECRTTRLGRHKQGQGDLRSKEEVAELARRDPLLRARIAPERRLELERHADGAIAEAMALPPPAQERGSV